MSENFYDSKIQYHPRKKFVFVILILKKKQFQFLAPKIIILNFKDPEKFPIF